MKRQDLSTRAFDLYNIKLIFVTYYFEDVLQFLWNSNYKISCKKRAQFFLRHNYQLSFHITQVKIN